jgi:DNA-binding MarR family transcriptional regulator
MTTENMWGAASGMLTRLLHVVDRSVLREITDRLAPYRLSQPQAVTVCYLHDHADEDVYQRTLERELGLSNPTVAAMVKSLIANDVVYRIRSKTDRRYYRLKLTPHGEELYEPARDVLTSVSRKYEEMLEPDEVAELMRLLGKLYPHPTEKEVEASQQS